MTYDVALTELALQDLDGIHAFLLEREGALRATAIQNGLLGLIESLHSQAQRGHLPPELEGMGVLNTFEVHFKPYRILYQIQKRSVIVFLVADGRRNFTHLISRRVVL